MKLWNHLTILCYLGDPVPHSIHFECKHESLQKGMLLHDIGAYLEFRCFFSAEAYVTKLLTFEYNSRCFFFGDVSSKRDPTTYLTYVLALYDHYFTTKIQGSSGLPLIINTPGWVKGWSLLFVLFILYTLRPCQSVIKFKIGYNVLVYHKICW